MTRVPVMQCVCIVLGNERDGEMAGETTRKRLDAWQAVTAFVGITAGLLPLVQVLLGGGPGLWRLVVGDAAGPAAYVPPLAILAVAVAVIAWLESLKRKP